MSAGTAPLRRLRGLLPAFRPYRGRVALGITAILLSVAFGLLAPQLIGAAVDAFRRNPSHAALLRYALGLVGVAAVQGIFSFVQRRVLVGVSRDIEVDLRDRYFAHLERQPPAFFQERATGDLMARATSDLNAVRMLCGPAIMYSSQTLFTAIGALLAMARLDLPLTGVALAALPAVAGATKVFGERIHHRYERVQQGFARLTARVQESLAGARVVRAYAQEEAERRAFGELNAAYLEENRRLVRITAAFHPLLQVLVGCGFVAVLYFGGRQIHAGAITVGEFVAFNFFLAKLVWPMIAIGWVINLVQRGAASFGRLLEILEVEPAVADHEPLVRGARLRGAVSCRGLVFAYQPGGEPVLGPLAFEVPAGGSLGLVGATGAGKSTLLSLLPRLWEPPEGSLFLDGIDVRRLPLAELRAAIAMVPQESFLFSATLAENIAFGRPEASAAEILEAAHLAGLEPDLEALPNGLDTVVGERGLTLSGGQKQRVALARALLRRPRVLLLDDCLSAVDAATEARVLGNLARAGEGRTVLVVSHRIAAVAACDLVLVLAAGRITERGTPAELLAAGGAYAELARLQTLEEELAAV